MCDPRFKLLPWIQCDKTKEQVYNRVAGKVAAIVSVSSSAGSIYSMPEISRYLVLRKHDISYFRSFRYQFDRSLPSVFPVQEEKISKIIT